MIGTRQPTIDEAVEIIIRYAFADAVRDKARAQWKKHRK
jgi:hypothetical protein